MSNDHDHDDKRYDAVECQSDTRALGTSDYGQMVLGPPDRLLYIKLFAPLRSVVEWIDQPNAASELVSS